MMKPRAGHSTVLAHAGSIIRLEHVLVDSIRIRTISQVARHCHPVRFIDPNKKLAKLLCRDMGLDMVRRLTEHNQHILIGTPIWAIFFVEGMRSGSVTTLKPLSTPHFSTNLHTADCFQCPNMNFPCRIGMSTQPVSAERRPAEF